MATVSKEIADVIIKNNGWYPGDPRVLKVVQYENQWNGSKAYGIIYPHDDYYRYENALACHNCVVLWEAK